MRGIDATLRELAGGLYDVEIGFDGDLRTGDQFDSAILVSLFVDARADESDVAQPHRRRGWIGNEATPGFEMGSTLWVPLEQSRLTRTTLNQIEDAAREALSWLVEDGYAEAISNVSARVVSGRATLEVTIERSPSEVERRFFVLWDNTGTER